jgi:hypothetical protein
VRLAKGLYLLNITLDPENVMYVCMYVCMYVYVRARRRFLCQIWKVIKGYDGWGERYKVGYLPMNQNLKHRKTASHF